MSVTPQDSRLDDESLVTQGASVDYFGEPSTSPGMQDLSIPVSTQMTAEFMDDFPDDTFSLGSDATIEGFSDWDEPTDPPFPLPSPPLSIGPFPAGISEENGSSIAVTTVHSQSSPDPSAAVVDDDPLKEVTERWVSTLLDHEPEEWDFNIDSSNPAKSALISANVDPNVSSSIDLYKSEEDGNLIHSLETQQSQSHSSMTAVEQSESMDWDDSKPDARSSAASKKGTRRERKKRKPRKRRKAKHKSADTFNHLQRPSQEMSEMQRQREELAMQSLWNKVRSEPDVNASSEPSESLIEQSSLKTMSTGPSRLVYAPVQRDRSEKKEATMTRAYRPGLNTSTHQSSSLSSSSKPIKVVAQTKPSPLQTLAKRFEHHFGFELSREGRSVTRELQTMENKREVLMKQASAMQRRLMAHSGRSLGPDWEKLAQLKTRVKQITEDLKMKLKDCMVNHSCLAVTAKCDSKLWRLWSEEIQHLVTFYRTQKKNAPSSSIVSDTAMSKTADSAAERAAQQERMAAALLEYEDQIQKILFNLKHCIRCALDCYFGIINGLVRNGQSLKIKLKIVDGSSDGRNSSVDRMVRRSSSASVASSTRVSKSESLDFNLEESPPAFRDISDLMYPPMMDPLKDDPSDVSALAVSASIIPIPSEIELKMLSDEMKKKQEMEHKLKSLTLLHSLCIGTIGDLYRYSMKYNLKMDVDSEHLSLIAGMLDTLKNENNSDNDVDYDHDGDDEHEEDEEDEHRHQHHRHPPMFEVVRSFYMQSLRLDPTIGKMYNSLAVISYNRDSEINVVYFYIRALCSKRKFSANENLLRAIESNRERFEKYLIEEKVKQHLMLSAKQKKLSSVADSARKVGRNSRVVGVSSHSSSLITMIPESNSSSTDRSTPLSLRTENNPNDEDLSLEHRFNKILRHFEFRLCRIWGMVYSRTGLESFDTLIRRCLVDFQRLVTFVDTEEPPDTLDEVDQGQCDESNLMIQEVSMLRMMLCFIFLIERTYIKRQIAFEQRMISKKKKKDSGGTSQSIHIGNQHKSNQMNIKMLERNIVNGKCPMEYSKLGSVATKTINLLFDLMDVCLHRLDRVLHSDDDDDYDETHERRRSKGKKSPRCMPHLFSVVVVCLWLANSPSLLRDNSSESAHSFARILHSFGNELLFAGMSQALSDDLILIDGSMSLLFDELKGFLYTDSLSLFAQLFEQIHPLRHQRLSFDTVINESQSKPLSAALYSVFMDSLRKLLDPLKKDEDGSTLSDSSFGGFALPRLPKSKSPSAIPEPSKKKVKVKPYQSVAKKREHPRRPPLKHVRMDYTDESGEYKSARIKEDDRKTGNGSSNVVLNSSAIAERLTSDTPAVIISAAAELSRKEEEKKQSGFRKKALSVDRRKLDLVETTLTPRAMVYHSGASVGSGPYRHGRRQLSYSLQKPPPNTTIVVDALNVCRSLGQGKRFCVEGLVQALEFFRDLPYSKVVACLPEVYIQSGVRKVFDHSLTPDNPTLLRTLRDQCVLYTTRDEFQTFHQTSPIDVSDSRSSRRSTSDLYRRHRTDTMKVKHSCPDWESMSVVKFARSLRRFDDRSGQASNHVCLLSNVGFWRMFQQWENVRYVCTSPASASRNGLSSGVNRSRMNRDKQRIEKWVSKHTINFSVIESEVVPDTRYVFSIP